MMIVLLVLGCGTPTGPSEHENPGGGVIAWFNNDATVDLYFPAEDSLVKYAYVTGDWPSDILDPGEGRIAVLSSFKSVFQVFSLDATGSELFNISLPAGSNPYSMTMCDDEVWATLLLSSQVASFDPVLGAAVMLYDVASNPTGITASSDKIFVGHGNWPDTTSTIGGITVLDASSGDSLSFIDTPENTWCLGYFEETDTVHAISTTYVGDGMISIIDPESMGIQASIETGGTPGAPVRVGSLYAAGDGWSSDAVYFYNETGVQSVWHTGFNASGLAVSGDTLYITDSSRDIVLISDWRKEIILDTLSTGDGPMGIVTAVN